MKEENFSYKFLILIIILFTCLFLFSATSLSVLAASPNLELTPSIQSVNLGNQATINVVVEEVTDLRGANIILNFDASKLQYISSAAGIFIPDATLMTSSTNGSITLDVAGLGIFSYASGTGTIITIVFERIAAGNTNITFGVTDLRDRDNVSISHTTGSGCLITSLPGDFGGPNNGPPDGAIDFEDLMIFAMAYGSTPSDPNWNPVCDIAGDGGVLEPDGMIDFEDLMIFAMHYGQSVESMGAIRGVVNVAYWSGTGGFFPGAARIDVLGREMFTVSSFSDGSYTLNNVLVGEYTIRAFKHGFISAQQIVEVVEGQAVTDINFDLVSEVPADQKNGIYYLCFNLDMPPFDNLKVRQALNYAIDKQTLVNEFNAEFGLDKEVAQGPIPPGMIGYNPSLVGYTYDINQAEVLLSQAGYPDGFSTDLYFNENAGHRFIAEKIKMYLAQIGVDVEIHGMEWTIYLAMITEGELPFFRLGWISDTPDPTDLLYGLYHTEGGGNYVHYYNLIVDSQIEQAWEIIDEASFIQLIQQTEITIVEEAPAIFLYYY